MLDWLKVEDHRGLPLGGPSSPSAHIPEQVGSLSLLKDTPTGVFGCLKYVYEHWRSLGLELRWGSSVLRRAVSLEQPSCFRLDYLATDKSFVRMQLWFD